MRVSAILSGQVLRNGQNARGRENIALSLHCTQKALMKIL
jgi:hypothetical protein